MSRWRPSFRVCRQYTGKLKAVILDWSGTTADKYVIAPATTFSEVFKRQGVPITMAEARQPMGLRKDLHIKAIADMPDVRRRWKDVHGKDLTANDVQTMYDEFVPMQLQCLRDYAELIPGCAQATQTLQNEFNMKIGSTTGFVRSMVDVLVEEAAKQGYKPDATVAGDDVINGTRPKPFMIYRNLDLLDVHPIQAVVKVDDTTSGIEEAQEAGCWGVGVARYSNYMNIDSYDHEASLTQDDINQRLEGTRDILVRCGAHYVIDSIAELPEVCEDINRRLANGEKP